MKPTHTKVTASHVLEDGRILTCTFVQVTFHGNKSGSHDDSFDDEHDVSDPEYELDGDPVEQDDLPEELQPVAVRMYQESYRFKTKEEPVDAAF